MDIGLAKKSLRKKLDESRQQMPRSLFEDECFKTCTLIKSFFDSNNYTKLVSYVAKGRELDLTELHRYVWSKGQAIYFPKVERNKRLLWGTALSIEDFELGSFGVLEPKTEVVAIEELEDNLLVVVPGLGFTEQGARIGWGKGYYDSQLPQMASKNCCIVGVGLSSQLCDEIPLEDHDFILNNLIIGGRFIKL